MQAQQFSNCKQRLIVGCELQFSQSGICELLVNNLAVSRNSCQSVLHQSVLSFYIISNLQLKKSKINKVIDVFQSRYTSNSNHKIYYDLNGDELEKICKHLCKYRLIIEAAVYRYRNDCSTDFAKFLGKRPRWSTILVQLQALQFY